MRRRHVLAIALATAILFALAGTAFGHYVVPSSKGDTANCVALKSALERGPASAANEGLNFDAMRDFYDRECR